MLSFVAIPLIFYTATSDLILNILYEVLNSLESEIKLVFNENLQT